MRNKNYNAQLFLTTGTQLGLKMRGNTQLTLKSHKSVAMKII